MKRLIAILVLSTILCVNPCCAKARKFEKGVQKTYANEIETLISNEIGKSLEEVNVWYLKANTIYAQFLKDKNQMKRNYDFVTTLTLYEEDIASPEFDLYSKLIDITKKYDIFIEDKIPATGFAGTLYDFLIPYFKKNSVNYTKLDELSDDIAIKAEKIEKFKTDIYDYSRKYEETKIDNFYKNVISPRLEATKLTNLHYILMYNAAPKTGVLYFAKAQVNQIISGGFLADLNPDQDNYNSVIFVKDNNSNKLLMGDVFDPYLPLKFTGQYFYYVNYYGEKRKAPIMIVSFPSCASKTLPQIGETFYFAEKPHYSYNNENYCISNIYVINDRRAYRNMGNPYMKWK